MGVRVYRECPEHVVWGGVFPLFVFALFMFFACHKPRRCLLGAIT